MTSPSKGAPIYYMTARVAFKKAKKVHERVVWIVSVFDEPHDIVSYDRKTMARLELELYGKNYKSKRHIVVRDILDKSVVGHSNLNLNEHRKQN